VAKEKHLSMIYSFSNKCAKSFFYKWTVLVQLIMRLRLRIS